eukprot:364588-Chlamydomonas_euryale.AAC.2
MGGCCGAAVGLAAGPAASAVAEGQLRHGRLLASCGMGSAMGGTGHGSWKASSVLAAGQLRHVTATLQAHSLPGEHVVAGLSVHGLACMLCVQSACRETSARRCLFASRRSSCHVGNERAAVLACQQAKQLPCEAAPGGSGWRCGALAGEAGRCAARWQRRRGGHGRHPARAADAARGYGGAAGERAAIPAAAAAAGRARCAHVLKAGVCGRRVRNFE